MSDPIGHECGVAFIRLLKPLAYYQEKYGTSLYGFNKLFLLMEKQHNRGQDGVGIGSCKIDVPLGAPYLFRSRNAEVDSLPAIFREQLLNFDRLADRGILDPDDPRSIEEHFEFGGQVLMGHLRYGTSGVFGAGSCHPYIRRSNWRARSLMLLGNFNMTNAAQLNSKLIQRGQHPVFDTDTQTVLEEIGYHLDEAHSELYHKHREEGIEREQIAAKISDEIDIAEVVSEAAKIWDGGYTIAGAVGNGDSFIFRDPKGIRPCYYFANDEVVACASERVPLATVFDLDPTAEGAEGEIQELTPGEIITIKADGKIKQERFIEEQKPIPCSFERIYFSRGNDPDIYRERKALGAALVPQIAELISEDFNKTVFSFVPNTAEIAYYGMMDGLRLMRREQVSDALKAKLSQGSLDESEIDNLILEGWPRGEKVAHKDVKMRTFISQEQNRNQLVSHIYDISYGAVNPGDSLVVIDDSIVRGTTLRQSILKILSRTNPVRIVIASTAPQIRYPDCYGIDMSELGKFIAFQAAVELIQQSGRSGLLKQTYENCCAELEKSDQEMRNAVQDIYEPFSSEEISIKIAELVYPDSVPWKGDLHVIYQSIENLHQCLPGYGDWYFTGNYPTPGGCRVANMAFVQYYEKKEGRPYDMLFENHSGSDANDTNSAINEAL